MTNGVVTSPSPPTLPYREQVQARELSLSETSSHQVRFDDGAGNAFNLSIERHTDVYAATYDRSAQVLGGSRGRHHGHAPHHAEHKGMRSQLKELREDLNDVTRTLRDLGYDVKGFKKAVHRLLKAVDQGYREHFRRLDPVEAEIRAFETTHAELLQVNQSVKIEMDVVDPEYWSVENTAGRLVDFAVALYGGGDRSEHVTAMVAAMEQGHREAAAAFGGSLPPIADETLARAQEMLTEWAGGAESEVQEPAAEVALVA